MSEDVVVTELMNSDPAYSTEHGAAYLGDSKNLLSELPKNSIDLVVTSPPFALQHQKEYGNETLEEYNDWFVEFAQGVKRVLQPHGSFIIEIGGAFERGQPIRSTYQFELLHRLTKEEEVDLEFAQDFYWFNPAKLPNPIEWVNVRKIRATDSMTHIWWLAKEINKDPAYTEELRKKIEFCKTAQAKLRGKIELGNLLKIIEAILRGEINGENEATDYYSEDVRSIIAEELPGIAEEIDELIRSSEKAPQVYVNEVLDSVEGGKGIPEPNPKPEANNQRVLQEYSESQKNLIETGEYNSGKRPSGWDIDPDSFATDNRGAIPKNLIKASNTASNTHYLEMCRKFNRDSHPARFPREIPEFFIDFLTPNPPYDNWNRGEVDRPIVLDIFAGSNVTGKVAQEKERYWLSFEMDRDYVETSRFRFLEEEEIRMEIENSQQGFEDFVSTD